MTENAPKWSLRAGCPEDICFIYSTWLKSYRTGSGLGLASGKHAYFLTYNLIIDQILGRSDTAVWVAVKFDEPNVIWGYAVSEPGVLHYVFVKEAFRKFGIARSLYQNSFNARPFVTHVTQDARDVMCGHPGFRFDVNLLLSSDKGDSDHGEKRNSRFAN